MGNDERLASKEQLVALMQAGSSWQEAAAQAGIQVSRSTAYRWLHQIRTRDGASLADGRHGHPAKVSPAVREFLETTYCECHEHSGREMQITVQERFGVLISIGHLNRLRAALTGGTHRAAQEKKRSARFPTRQFSGKRGQGDYCCLPPQTRLACSPP